MIADLTESTDIRLITKNVMAVFSTDEKLTDSFIRRLKTHSYIVNDKQLTARDIISYVVKNYNIYENLFRFVERNSEFNSDKFIEYLNYFNLGRLLWLHFYQLRKEDLSLVEILLQLSTEKHFIITDYVDCSKYKLKLYSLFLHVALDDKLIIVPFKNIDDAVNYTTCQCYVKNESAVKIMTRFPNEFLNYEFHNSKLYYKPILPHIYENNSIILAPSSYKYSLYELFLILLFSIKMLFTYLYNWRMKQYVNRLHS